MVEIGSIAGVSILYIIGCLLKCAIEVNGANQRSAEAQNLLYLHCISNCLIPTGLPDPDRYNNESLVDPTDFVDPADLVDPDNLPGYLDLVDPNDLVDPDDLPDSSDDDNGDDSSDDSGIDEREIDWGWYRARFIDTGEHERYFSDKEE